MIRKATEYESNDVDDSQQPDADSQSSVDGSDHSDSRQLEVCESTQKIQTVDSRDKSTTQTSKPNLRPILPKSSYAIVAKLQNFVANSFPPVSTILDTTSDPVPVLVERKVPSNSVKMLQTQIHCFPGPFGLCQKLPANQGNSSEGLVMHQNQFLPITVSGPTLITIVPEIKNKPVHVTDKEEDKLKGVKDDQLNKDKTEVRGTFPASTESTLNGTEPATSCPMTYENGSIDCSPDPINECLGVTDAAASSFVKEPLRNKGDKIALSGDGSEDVNQGKSPTTSTEITSIVTTVNALDSQSGAKCNVTTAIETPFMHKFPSNGALKGAQEDLIEKAKAYRFASGKSQAPLYVSQDIVLSGGIAQQNRRRIIHNQVEKRRKEKINGWIGRIGELLFRYCPEKQSKNVILEKTYEFIQETQEENNQKSKTCFCGGKPNDRNNLPELVAKIAELENLVKVLLQTVTKHRVPVPPSVKQCGGHFTKHLDLIYENTSPQLCKGPVTGSSSRGIAGEKRFPEKSSLPFISSVMYSRPTASEDTEVRTENQSRLSSVSGSVSAIPIATSVPPVNANAVFSQSSPSNSCPPPPSISRVWTEQTVSTEESPQHPPNPSLTDSRHVSLSNTSVHSSAVSVTSTVDVYPMNNSTQAGVPLVGYVLSVSSPQETSTYSKDAQQSVMAVKETETLSSVANVAACGLNTQWLHRAGQSESEKNCSYLKMVTLGADLPRLQTKVGDKTNESAYSVNNLINTSQSMDLATSKVSVSLSSIAPVHSPCRTTQMTDRGINVPYSSLVSSSVPEKCVSVGHAVQSSVAKSASGKLETSSLPGKSMVSLKSLLSHSGSRADTIYSIANQANGNRESTNLSLSLNPKSLTIVGPQSVPVTFTGSAPHTIESVGSNMTHESQSRLLMNLNQNQESHTSGISPLVVNHSYTTSLSQQLLQHSVSEHPSPTYPITPARTNASTVSLCKNLHFNRPAQLFTSKEQSNNTVSEEKQSPSKEFAMKPKQKIVPPKPLYSVSRLLGESKGPSYFSGEEHPSKSAASTEKGVVDFGIHASTLPSPIAPPLPNQHVQATLYDVQSCSSVSVSPLSLTKTRTSSSLACSNAVSTSPFFAAKAPQENQMISVSTSFREGITGITFAGQISHSSAVKETSTAKKAAKRRVRETTFNMNNSDILMTSFQLPSKRSKSSAYVPYGSTAKERNSSKGKVLSSPVGDVSSMQASRIDSMDVLSKSNALTVGKTVVNKSSVRKELSNQRSLTSSKKAVSGSSSLDSKSSIDKEKPSKAQQGSKTAKFMEGGRSNKGRKVNSSNGEGRPEQFLETVVSASLNAKIANAPKAAVRANNSEKSVPSSKSGHILKPSCSVSSFYPKPQNFISLAGQGPRKPDGIPLHANSQNFSTEAILRQDNQNCPEMNVQSCNPAYQLPVSGNTISLPRTDVISGHVPGAVAQDNSFPTILNIFAPVSLNNMIQFNNSSLSNAGEDALPLPSSLSGVHSTYSNFSAEALIGALDNQPLSGTAPAPSNIPDNNSNMLVQPGNQHLFTDFSTDTLLNASDTNLSYGIDNIMSRQENPSTVSCVSPNWLQNGGFVAENSPIKSIMSILESTTHVSSGLTNPASQSGSLAGTLPYTAALAPLHGPQGNVVIGPGKSYIETSLVRNEDMLASTPMWCWGANSVTGQPVPSGYAVVQGERSRLGVGNGSMQTSKPGPSYGNYLLVNSVS